MLFSAVIIAFLYSHFHNNFDIRDNNNNVKIDLQNVYEYSVLKYGAKGDDLDDDLLAIQRAINQANKDGGGEVYVPRGKYYVEKTIQIKSNVKLILNKGATLYVKNNVNVVQIRLNGSIQGGTINTGLVKDYNSSVIYLDGQDGFSSGNHQTMISDINILGNGNGNAIYFNAKNHLDCISWVQVRNLNIYGFGRAIYFKTATLKDSNIIWINGNTFNQVNISNCKFGIFLDGHAYLPNEIAGNSFTNIQIQISEITEYGIFVKGNRNYFEATIWDSQGTNAAKFDVDSYRNKLVSNIKMNSLIDLGKENIINFY
ncbi:glycosyl hydrolase family 28-related protein [Peribacillus sp. NPDC096622]|uniref:glycosyl hydrolase family 28-related protein n=1 Tax=Peribacillus sp. NPDC096622 TaxID=3364396 RepID=UPI0037F3BC13